MGRIEDEENCKGPRPSGDRIGLIGWHESSRVSRKAELPESKAVEMALFAMFLGNPASWRPLRGHGEFASWRQVEFLPCGSAMPAERGNRAPMGCLNPSGLQSNRSYDDES